MYMHISATLATINNVVFQKKEVIVIWNDKIFTSYAIWLKSTCPYYFLQVPDLINPVDKHSYRASYPLSHDVNQTTRSVDSLDLVIGFNSGPLQRINPITKSSIALYNNDVSTVCVLVCTVLVIISHMCFIWQSMCIVQPDVPVVHYKNDIQTRPIEMSWMQVACTNFKEHESCIAL